MSKIAVMIISLLMLSVLALFISCQEYTVAPLNNDDMILSFKTEAFDISAMKNKPFRLAFVALGDSMLDMNNFKPFNMVLNDTMFYGDDGCNSFKAFFTLLNDSITFTDGELNDLACLDKPQFDPRQHFFFGKLRIRQTKNEVLLQRGDEVYIYMSTFSAQLTILPYLGSTMKLKYSNDPTFRKFDSLGVQFSLLFNSERKYTFKYSNDPEDHWANLETNGIFGIGNERRLRMYSMSVKPTTKYYEGNSASLLRLRILSANKYFYTDSTLMLTAQLEKAVGSIYLNYEFAPDSL